MKLGMIGFGQRIASVLGAFRAEDPGLEIVGLVDSNPEEARGRMPEEFRARLRIFDSLPELVEKGKPDALVIGTRCDSHAALAIQAARYDLPLFLEKPVATNLRDAIKLEQAFANSKCRVLVSFPLRVSLLCRRAKSLIDQGVVGRVEHLTGLNYVPYGDVYFQTWYRDHSITGGLFLQKATHDFDYLAYLAGAPIVRVAAMVSKGRVYRDKRTKKAGRDPFALYAENVGTPGTGMNEDSSSALLEFANGVKGCYTQVFYSKGEAARRGAIVSGFSGTVDFDWYRNDLKCFHHHEPFTDVVTVGKEAGHFGGDAALAKNFIAIVRDGGESLAPIGCGLQSVYACLAAKESAEKGRFLPVRQLL